MREILFRGKRRDNGKWVEGSLAASNGVINIGRAYILPSFTNLYSDRFSEARIGNFIEVYPNTVGQYTGLCDKNGKKIFEGDIVEYNTFNDFDCYSIVGFGEYPQDGSSGEYNARMCTGWFVKVSNFTCPDWADSEDEPWMFFSEYLSWQNLLEIASDCEVIGNIHDNIDLVR